MYFGTSFGAEDEVRLPPFEDDKPKGAENTIFQAGSDNYCHPKQINSAQNIRRKKQWILWIPLKAPF